VDDSPSSGKRDLIIQVMTEEPEILINDLTEMGYKVDLRKRRFWPRSEG